MALFLLISISSMIGGESPRNNIIPILKSFSLISLVISLLIFSSLIKPLVWINYLDKLRIPRSIIYILISPITSFSILISNSTRIQHLLKIKGYSFNSFSGKFRGYIKLVSPLFMILFSNIITQSQSLSQRNFFKKPNYFPKINLQWDLSQLLWLLICLSIILRLVF